MSEKLTEGNIMDAASVLRLAAELVVGHDADRYETTLKRLQRQAGKIGSALQGLASHGVVYFVLNHQHWNLRDRHFVAWLNGVEKEQSGTFHLFEDVNDDAAVCILGTKEKREFAEALLGQWLVTWKEYQELTDSLCQRGLATWNRLLLAHCGMPGPLGLVWDDFELAENTPYVRVLPGDFCSLDLPIPTDGATVPDPKIFIESRCPGAECPLARLESRLDELDQVGLAREAIRPQHALAACLAWHLLRSYGKWGGHAFLSLPVLFRDPAPGAVTILSICTERPLQASDLLAWAHLANVALGPLAGAEKYSWLVHGISLDHLAPSALYALTGLSVRGSMLDTIIWRKAGEAIPEEWRAKHCHALFTLRSFVEALYDPKLSAPVPPFGFVSLAALLRAEFKVGPEDLSVAQLAQKAAENESQRERVARLLQGKLSDTTDTVRRLFDDALEEARLTCAVEEDAPISEEDPIVENHRFYVSTWRLAEYLRTAITAVMQCPEAQRLRVKAGILRDINGDQGCVWVILLNGPVECNAQWNAAPGETGKELAQIGSTLSARSVFRGILYNERVHFPDVLWGDPTWCDRAAAISGQIVPGESGESPMFICALGLPLFPARRG